MKASATVGTLTVSSPEDGLVINPEVDPMDMDMLQGILNRSKALLSMLSGYFETSDDQRGFKVSDQTLSNLIWQLNGNLELLNELVAQNRLKR